LPKAKPRRDQAAHKPWPLEQRPGFLIRRLHQIHVALFQEACSAFEMTPLQYSLLSALAVRGTADQTTLAADIALDRTTTTGALKRLEARKLVERPVSDDDRRARRPAPRCSTRSKPPPATRIARPWAASQRRNRPPSST
jgi:MarR family transcriptional regulator, lower aerobic nicotinate degradation pathway regulator